MNNYFEKCDMSGVETEGTEFIENYKIDTSIGVPYDMQ